MEWADLVRCGDRLEQGEKAENLAWQGAVLTLMGVFSLRPTSSSSPPEKLWRLFCKC